MPSAAVIDSQSVKGGQLPALSCGYDAGKKIKGRKRHVRTDTNGPPPGTQFGDTVRHRHMKSRAVGAAGMKPDFAAMGAHQFGADRQPKPDAA